MSYRPLLGQTTTAEISSGVYKEHLRRHHIRLVSIRRGTWDSEINCELFHLDIDADEIPRYRALSYVWGLLTGTRHISSLKVIDIK
jgi:hypothetical protein